MQFSVAEVVRTGRELCYPTSGMRCIGASVCLQSASRAVQLEGLLFLPELSLFLKSLVRPRQTCQLG